MFVALHVFYRDPLQLTKREKGGDDDDIGKTRSEILKKDFV